MSKKNSHRSGHRDSSEPGTNKARVSRAIYGVITVLSVLQAMSLHPPSAWHGTFLLFGTTLAVALADAYSDSIALMLTGQRSLTMNDWREIGHEVAPVMTGAQAPTVLLLLSALGLFSMNHAISLAEAAAILLLFGFGIRIGQQLHEHLFRQLLSGLFLVAIGGLTVAIKVFFH